MGTIVEVTERLAEATAAQHGRTARALRKGRPDEAATDEQSKLRQAYLRRNWPALAEEIDLEGRIGADDTLWSSFLSRGAVCSRAVARVVWKERPAETRWEGTAFLISDCVAVTNNHVMDSPEAAAELGLEFDYEFDERGRERGARLYDLAPERLFLTFRRVPELDYTLVAVAPAKNGDPPGKRRGYLPLVEQTGKAKNGDALNLIHHPGGARKRISIRESRLLGTDEFTLQYSGDTLGGSSGSPIFNDQWEVVGLHFGGRPKRDANNHKLAVDGSVWDPSMGDDKVAYDFNVGTRISRLIADARRRGPDLTAGRDLLDAAIGAAS
jgi:V8-like Glu-specific endopeptidase